MLPHHCSYLFPTPALSLVSLISESSISSSSIMIPWPSSQLNHRNDENRLDNVNVYVQIRNVVDHVTAAVLVVVRRASKYALFTFLDNIFSSMIRFTSSPERLVYQDLKIPCSCVLKPSENILLHSCLLSMETPLFNLLSSGLTPGYTLGTVLGVLGGVALLVILFFIRYRRRFFPDGYSEEESNVASNASPTPAPA